MGKYSLCLVIIITDTEIKYKYKQSDTKLGNIFLVRSNPIFYFRILDLRKNIRILLFELIKCKVAIVHK